MTDCLQSLFFPSGRAFNSRCNVCFGIGIHKLLIPRRPRRGRTSALFMSRRIALIRPSLVNSLLSEVATKTEVESRAQVEGPDVPEDIISVIILAN
jgi:hypothetical protein